MKILDINKIKLNTRLYDKNEVEAFDGDIIKCVNGNIFEVYWNEMYQWSKRDIEKSNYGIKVFRGSLMSSKYIVPEELKWKIIERKNK